MTMQLKAPVLEKLQLEELKLQSTYIQEEDEPKKMATGLHGAISSNINGDLSVYVRSNKLGRVFDSSTTYNFRDGQPKRMPDVSFITQERVPTKLDEELSIAPDLAVEVVSKNDTVFEVEVKVKQYQQAGVKLIWIVYPFSQTVEVYRLNDKIGSQRFGGDGGLEGGEVLPGFKLAVSSIFE